MAKGEAVQPVCQAIWEELGPKVIPQPNEDYWKYQERGFCERWQFPNCIGAIDGKHIRIQAPPNSVSLFYNYKQYFSVVLFAVAGFDYRFSFVDTGAFGSQNDSQIFNDCKFNKKLIDGSLKLPRPCTLPNDLSDKKVPSYSLATMRSGCLAMFSKPTDRVG